MSFKPITLNLYNEDGTIKRSYTRQHISWGFYKRASALPMPNEAMASDENMTIIRRFVCEFFDNQFTDEDLEKYSDVQEVFAVGNYVADRVINLMVEEGIFDPNALATAE